MSKFTNGGVWPPNEEKDECYYAAGIDHQYAQCPGTGDVWLHRIQCYGQTQEDAEALRDRVMRGLALVEMEEQAGRAAELCSGGGA